MTHRVNKHVLQKYDRPKSKVLTYIEIRQGKYFFNSKSCMLDCQVYPVRNILFLAKYNSCM